MIKKLLNPKVIKFLLGGGIAAALNLLLIYFFIDLLSFDTPFLRNLANVLSIEISLVASFFIYRVWVWPGGSLQLYQVILKQLPLYHLSAGAAVLLRIFLVFPALDWLDINYTVNTLIGVLVSASLNYVISDRIVFSPKKNSSKAHSQGPRSRLYPPEGLAPGLEMTSSNIAISSTPSANFLSVVMPAHNEEGCVSETIEFITERLSAASIRYEILVVNDNSKDKTELILQALQAEHPQVRYINNYYPNGFGFAVRCGLENFKGDCVAVMMADNSDSPDDLLRYYHKLQEGYDCVFGSRFVKGGRVIDYPIHKLFINRLANLFVRTIFGFGFNDTTNAFKLYRRDVIEGIAPLVSHHFNLTVEMPLKAIARGYSYATVPITWQNRKAGFSKLKIKEMGSRYLFIVLYIWLEKHLSRGDYHRSKREQLAKSNG